MSAQLVNYFPTPNLPSGSNTRREKPIFHQRTEKPSPLKILPTRVAQRISVFRLQRNLQLESGAWVPMLVSHSILCSLNQQICPREIRRTKMPKSICFRSRERRGTADRSSLVAIQFRRMLLSHPSHKSACSGRCDIN